MAGLSIHCREHGAYLYNQLREMALFGINVHFQAQIGLKQMNQKQEDEIAVAVAEAWLSFDGEKNKEHPSLPKGIKHTGDFPLAQKVLREVVEHHWAQAGIDKQSKDSSDSRVVKQYYQRAFKDRLVELRRTETETPKYTWGGGHRVEDTWHKRPLSNLSRKIERKYAVDGFNGHCTVVQENPEFKADEHECLGHAAAREMFASGILARNNLRLAVGSGRGVAATAKYLIAPKQKIEVLGEMRLLSLAGNLFDSASKGRLGNDISADMIASQLVQCFDADAFQIKKIRHPLINDNGAEILKKTWLSEEQWAENKPNCVLMGVGVLQSGLQHGLIRELNSKSIDISDGLRAKFDELLMQADEMHQLYGRFVVADLVNRVFFVDGGDTVCDGKVDKIAYANRRKKIRKLIDQINDSDAILSVKKRQLRDVSEHRIVICGGVEKAEACNHLLTREFDLGKESFHLCPTHLVTTKKLAERLLEL